MSQPSRSSHSSEETDVKIDTIVQHDVCRDQGRDGAVGSPRRGTDSAISGRAAQKRENMVFIVESGQELVPRVSTAGK